jgi:hypothetical protein
MPLVVDRRNDHARCLVDIKPPDLMCVLYRRAEVCEHIPDRGIRQGALGSSVMVDVRSRVADEAYRPGMQIVRVLGGKLGTPLFENQHSLPAVLPRRAFVCDVRQDTISDRNDRLRDARVQGVRLGIPLPA